MSSWTDLTLSDIDRLVLAMEQAGISLAGIMELIARVPPRHMVHGRITIESVIGLLNQTNGSTCLAADQLTDTPPPYGAAVDMFPPAGFSIATNSPPQEIRGCYWKEHDTRAGQWFWNNQRVMLVDFHDLTFQWTDYQDLYQCCTAWGDSATLANSRVLDFLLLHQELIPIEWQNKRIHFCGTLYEDENDLFVRCLIWDESSNTWSELRHNSIEDWESDGWDDEGDFFVIIFH